MLMRLRRAARRRIWNASSGGIVNRSARTPFACSMTTRESSASWSCAHFVASTSVKSTRRLSVRTVSGGVSTGSSKRRPAPSTTRRPSRTNAQLAVVSKVDKVRHRVGESALDAKRAVEARDLEGAQQTRVVADENELAAVADDAFRRAGEYAERRRV